MISAGRVKTIGDLILANVAAVMDATAWTAPTRRYVTTSTPAVDCEQLVLQFRGMGHNLGNIAQDGGWGGPQLPALTIPAAQWALWCHRCVPIVLEEGTEVYLPSVEEEAASGAELTADAVNMWTGVLASEGDTYATDPIPQRGLSIIGYEALANEGGFGGGVLYFNAQLYERA